MATHSTHRKSQKASISLNPWASVECSKSIKLWPDALKATKQLHFSPLSLWSSCTQRVLSTLRSQAESFSLTDAKYEDLSPQPSSGKSFNTWLLCLLRSFSDLALSVKNQHMEQCFSEIFKTAKSKWGTSKRAKCH